MWHKTTGDMLMHAARGDIAKTGAGERSRTLDLLITSQLLYQLSYAGEEGELCPRRRLSASRHALVLTCISPSAPAIRLRDAQPGAWSRRNSSVCSSEPAGTN